MKIIPLKKNGAVYSCNSYLLLGDWNRLEDVNTIIDPGVDAFIFGEIETLATGVGKMPVEQVILTHNHFDHSAAVQAIKQRFNARVLAFTEGPGVDELLRDGQLVKAGDGFLEVIHTPGHSTDSICLYAVKEKALFSGDTQVRVQTPGGIYSRDYQDAIQKLSNREIKAIYSGHDDPVLRNCRDMLLKTLQNISADQGVASYA